MACTKNGGENSEASVEMTNWGFFAEDRDNQLRVSWRQRINDILGYLSQAVAESSASEPYDHQTFWLSLKTIILVYTNHVKDNRS